MSTDTICFPIPKVAGINWRRRARVRVSTELLDHRPGRPERLTSEWLHSALLFPDDVAVGTVRRIREMDQVAILVYGGDLPEVPNGCPAPEVGAQYAQIDGTPKFLGFTVISPPEPMTRERAKEILHGLTPEQREAIAVLCETCEADGDYHFTGEGSVWCDDVQATLGVLADIYRTG